MIIPFNEIESGTPCLTVNRRLARTILTRYDLRMKEKGHKVWESPAIMPFLSWLRELWTDHSQEKFLLSPLRSLVLWEKILARDKLLIKGELLSGNEVAATAYEAYRLAAEYNLDTEDPLFSATEESRTLQRWSSRYENKLKELSFIDAGQLPVHLMALLNKKKVELPPKIIIAGYDEVSPLLSQLLSALKKNGCQVSFWPATGKKNIKPLEKPDTPDIIDTIEDISLYRLSDESDEARAAARWIRKRYRQGLKIGVLVPDLGRYRDKIIAAFNEELAPSSIFPWQIKRDLFNISLGSRLYDEPIVRFAVGLLGMDDRKRDMDEISAFLLSPYLTFSRSEQTGPAAMDAKLRKDNRFSLTIGGVWHAMKSADCGAPLFMNALEQLLKSNRERRSSMLPGAWSEFFSTLLKNMGWPAKAVRLSSREYVALQSFGEALSTLAGLDDITGPINKHEALKYLIKITKQSVFQEETKESPITVMGFLESGGMTFDEVWLLGAHDGLLPGQPSPNPFIPLKLQKENNLPKSTFKRELEFSKIHLQRILAGTKRMVLSFPERTDDKEVSISPLISHLADHIINGTRERGNRLIDSMAGLKTAKDCESLPGLQVKKNEPIKGGTLILKNQSDCPFRAFAVHRLNAGKPDDPEPGISSLERGSIIHRAMEHFWQKIKDDLTLRQYEKSGTLDDAITESARIGLGLLNSEEPGYDNYKKIEGERLTSLLHEWVQIELRRSPFRTVERESEKGIHIAGLHLASRIDRIDSIGENARAIIDYKSGAVNTADWASERPKEPQLMLYASAGNYDAILFAGLKRGDCRFAGIAREEGLFPGIRAFTSDPLFKKSDHIHNWEDLMEKWRKTLQNLASDFLKGEANVDPRDYGRDSSACKYCDLLLLCRVFERSTDF
ncbi:MAG: PD-(D/E)XK nuclease family protein [Deltaproteobacteria bacterium]|nr:PD-(D/E)XK nuclease family protein [Deltaproteobacteria bacterium]